MLGVRTFFAAEGDCPLEFFVSELSMRTFACLRNQLKAGFLQIFDQLANLSWHNSSSVKDLKDKDYAKFSGEIESSPTEAEYGCNGPSQF